ncbi:hypothetical protein GCM10022251_22410 [Phytohabitans flavus]|uniref:carboxymuconolactone decarboxylase family protein n=1 Tax=Phytohabitans flavus TaxID=1076124 RepID=UPI00156642F0|nr:carboxymuconolactone decarboxylase family protein [Phytohabitans flavus]
MGLTDPETLTGPRRALYDAIAGGPRRQQRGQVPIADEQGRLLGPFGLMLIAPEVGDAVQRLGAALRFQSGLSPRVRELAILTVAVATGCEFEWWAHEQAALAAGLDPAQLQSILDGSLPEGLTGAEREAARVCLALAHRHRLDDDEYASAERTLGPVTLAELTWLVGYYSTLALALAVFAPPSPAPSTEGQPSPSTGEQPSPSTGDQPDTSSRKPR